MFSKRYRFINLLLVVFLLATTGTGFVSSEANAADAASPALGTRTEVYFDYATTKTSAVPTITVYTGDFSTGAVTEMSYAYPEKQIANKSDNSQACRVADYTYLVKGPNGYVAYWTSCYSAKANKKDQQASRLYAFDLTTKKWSIVTEGNDANIAFYPRFGAYAVSPADSAYDLEATNVKTYDLKTKKLLLKSYDVPSEVGSTLSYVVMRDTLRYYGNKPYAYVGSFEFRLDKQGKKTEIGETREISDEQVSKTIGGLKYASYKDPKKKEMAYGYYKNKKFTQLSDPGYDAFVEFSPNDKYLVITQLPVARNKWAHTVDYKTKIIKAKTGKVLHALPMFGNYNVYSLYDWNYGDELVRVNFFMTNGSTQAGYLNLSSGIFTLAPDNKQENDRNHFFYDYSGTFTADFLSPATPGEILIDGKPVNYRGQGAFVAENGKWYAPVQDFADAVGAKVTTGAKEWTIASADGISYKLQLSQTIAAGAKRYAPVVDLAKGLGYGTTQYNPGSSPRSKYEVGHRKIAIYSSRYTEEQFLKDYPEATAAEGHYRVDGTAASFELDSGDYRSYSISLTGVYTFKNGYLYSLESDNSLTTLEKGLGYYDTLKKVLQAYGTGAKSRLKTRFGNDAIGYVYPGEGFKTLLLFYSYGNFAGEVTVFDDRPAGSAAEPTQI